MHFSFTVDTVHNKKNNEYYKDIRRLQKAAIVYVILLVGQLYFFYDSPTTWHVVLSYSVAIIGLAGFIAAFLVKGSVGSAQKLYDKNPLVPAMIAKKNRHSMVLIAVAPLPDGKRALIAREVNSVGDLKSIGSRIAAVAPSNARGTEATIVPINWATNDQKVIDEALGSINEKEWSELRGLLKRTDEVLESRNWLIRLD